MSKPLNKVPLLKNISSNQVKQIAALYSKYPGVFQQAYYEYSDGVELYTNVKQQINSVLKSSTAFPSYVVLAFYSIWKEDSTKSIADAFNKLKPIIKQQTVPYVPSSKYKIAYRGSGLKFDKLKSFVKKTKASDWRDYRSLDDIYKVYTKKAFTYTPKLSAQSWSVDLNFAENFVHQNSVLMTTTVTDDFLFDPLCEKITYTMIEKETVRVSNKPHKVLLLVPLDLFDDLEKYMMGSGKSQLDLEKTTKQVVHEKAATT